MPDFDRLLAQQRQMILSPQRARRDVVRAGLQATADVPYAEAIDAIDARKFDQALRGYGVLASERAFQADEEQRAFNRSLQERQFDALQAQRIWQQAQTEAERGDDAAKQLIELAGAYDDPMGLAAAVFARAEGDDINDISALPGLISEEAERLGIGRTAEAPTPRTDIGKINADLAAGLITPAQAMQASTALYAEDNETWRPMTEEERTQYSIPEGRAAQISSRGKGAVIGSQGGITLYNPDGSIMAQIGSDLPLTASQRGALARDTAESLRTTNENLAELESAMRTLQAGGPDAVAISGAVTRGLGGLVNQVSNFFDQGDWVDTTEAQEVKSQLGALFGRYIPTITAEEGGRYTEGDVNRAAGVLPANQQPEDIVLGSFGRIVTALETLWDIERRAQIRDRMKMDGHPATMDLTYEFGRQQEVARLIRTGMDAEDAINQVFDLVDKYQIPIDLRGLPDPRLR